MFLKPNSKIIIDVLLHVLLGQMGHRTDVKQAFSQECVPKKKNSISQPKHMLWILKRTVSMRQFF